MGDMVSVQSSSSLKSDDEEGKFEIEDKRDTWGMTELDGVGMHDEMGESNGDECGAVCVLREKRTTVR